VGVVRVPVRVVLRRKAVIQDEEEEGKVVVAATEAVGSRGSRSKAVISRIMILILRMMEF